MAYCWLDRQLLSAFEHITGPARVHAELGPSSPESTCAAPPIIRLKDRKTLIALLLNPEMNFGDLYCLGDVNVEGNLVRALETLYQAPDRLITRIISRWLGWLQSNSLRAARENIRHHYDVSTDFYKLWLDPKLVYTCAYFPDENASLEQAQWEKLDLVCRKLWLQPGEKVVGLASSIEFIQDDYRNITARCDAFVSIGMLEHIGREHYRELGDVVHRAIGKTGRGLLHFIGKNQRLPFSTWIRKRIFPGAYTPTLREVMDVLEPHDFSVLDVENLRLHYARTIECWLERYERCFNQVTKSFGPDFARMWRLYLAGSIAGFRTGTLQLFQVVFAGRACKSQPSTRAHLYSGTVHRAFQDVECTPAMS